MNAPVNAVQVRTAEEIEVGTGLDTEAKVAKDATLRLETRSAILATHVRTDQVAKHNTLGKRFLAQAKFRKANFADWGKTAYSDLLKEEETWAKFEHGISDIRLDVSVKIHGFVESCKARKVDASKVSYYRLANHFIPIFAWDVADLEGHIKSEWLAWVDQAIADNSETADHKPCSIADLRASVETEKARQAIERAKRSKVSAEKTDEQEAKAANAKLIAGKAKGNAKLTKVISDSIVAGELDGRDVRTTVSSVLESFKMSGPQTFDPATMSSKQIEEFLAILFATGRIAELKMIRDMSASMVDAAVAQLKIA